MNKKGDKQGRNPHGLWLDVSRNMSDGTHVSIKRMREATKDHDVLLTQMELSHINNCQECLWAFGMLVGDTDERNCEEKRRLFEAYTSAIEKCFAALTNILREFETLSRKDFGLRYRLSESMLQHVVDARITLDMHIKVHSC
jgi:hypothetical protein